MKNRIAEIIETQKLTSQKFASLIGIQPSAVSHMLSGRNNPSMDVIQKILNTFRTINPDWLILGVGSMYREIGETPKRQPVDVKIVPNKPQMASLFQDEPENDAEYSTENKVVASSVTPNLPSQKTFASSSSFERQAATMIGGERQSQKQFYFMRTGSSVWYDGVACTI
jgi:transcriptional regulator with XRE-family HTH domain